MASPVLVALEAGSEQPSAVARIALLGATVPLVASHTGIGRTARQENTSHTAERASVIPAQMESTNLGVARRIVIRARLGNTNHRMAARPATTALLANTSQTPAKLIVIAARLAKRHTREPNGRRTAVTALPENMHRRALPRRARTAPAENIRRPAHRHAATVRLANTRAGMPVHLARTAPVARQRADTLGGRIAARAV